MDKGHLVKINDMEASKISSTTTRLEQRKMIIKENDSTTVDDEQRADEQTCGTTVEFSVSTARGKS